MKRRKCPVCNSERIAVTGKSFYCLKCGFINKKVIVDRRKK